MHLVAIYHVLIHIHHDPARCFDHTSRRPRLSTIPGLVYQPNGPQNKCLPPQEFETEIPTSTVATNIIIILLLYITATTIGTPGGTEFDGNYHGRVTSRRECVDARRYVRSSTGIITVTSERMGCQ